MVKVDDVQGVVTIRRGGGAILATVGLLLNDNDVVDASSGSYCRLETYVPPAHVGMTAFVQNSGGTVSVTPGPGTNSMSGKFWSGGSYRYNLAPKSPPPASVGIRA